jgi:hypothetical protein
MTQHNMNANLQASIENVPLDSSEKQENGSTSILIDLGDTPVTVTPQKVPKDELLVNTSISVPVTNATPHQGKRKSKAQRK